MPSLRDLALSSSSLKARSVILLVLWILLKGWCTVKSLVNILNFCLILHLFNPCCYRTTGTLKKKYDDFIEDIMYRCSGQSNMSYFWNMQIWNWWSPLQICWILLPPSLASPPPPNSQKGCKVQYSKLKIFSQDQFVILICKTPDIRNRMRFFFQATPLLFRVLYKTI